MKSKTRSYGEEEEILILIESKSSSRLTYLTTAVQCLKIVLGEDSQSKLFRQIALIVFGEASAIHPPEESIPRLHRVFVGEIVENALGHRAAARVTLRHEQHFQLLPLLVLVLVGRRIPSEHLDVRSTVDKSILPQSLADRLLLD